MTEQEEQHVPGHGPLVMEDEPAPQIHAKTIALVIVSRNYLPIFFLLLGLLSPK